MGHGRSAEIDLASPLQFVINAAAGSSDAEVKREVVETALRAGGRRGDLLFCSPAELSGVAQQAATRGIATRTAVVAVGGDGTLNTVARAAHAAGCASSPAPIGGATAKGHTPVHRQRHRRRQTPPYRLM